MDDFIQELLVKGNDGPLDTRLVTLESAPASGAPRPLHSEMHDRIRAKPMPPPPLFNFSGLQSRSSFAETGGRTCQPVRKYEY